MRNVLIDLPLFLLIGSTASAQFSAQQPFAPLGGAAPGMESTDVDSDGDEDIVVLTGDTLLWMENRGPSGFVTRTLGALPSGSVELHLGDVDGDGDDDFWVGAGDGIYLARNAGNGMMAAPARIHDAPVRFFSVADLDSDKDPDVASWSPTQSTLTHENVGAGTFQLGQSAPPFGTTFDPESFLIADFNDDGAAEIIFGDTNFGSVMYRNNGQGGFSDAQVQLTGAHFMAVGDVNNDGLPDMVCTYYWGDGIRTQLNRGNFGFTTVLGGHQEFHFGDPKLADLDGDGVLDVYCKGNVPARVMWHRGLGDGSWGPGIPLSPNMDFSSFVAVDADQDLDLDLIADGGPNGSLVLFENLHTLGTTYCPATPNSAGAGAEIAATGSRVAEINQLQIQVEGLPPGQLTLLLNSQLRDLQTVPGSSGTLCLGAGVGRYSRPGEFDLADSVGAFTLNLHLPNTPTSMGSTAILSGQTWNFQAWYRDPQPGSATNFTSAIEIVLR